MSSALSTALTRTAASRPVLGMLSPLSGPLPARLLFVFGPVAGACFASRWTGTFCTSESVRGFSIASSCVLLPSYSSPRIASPSSILLALVAAADQIATVPQCTVCSALQLRPRDGDGSRRPQLLAAWSMAAAAAAAGPRPRRLRRAAGPGSLCHRRLCFLLLLVAESVSVVSGWVVTSLPGFDGPLPFHLETGYVEVDKHNGAELFYYFVEAESGAAAAAAAAGEQDVPFLLWLTGGDRCSVFSGLGFEIGPIRFVLEPYDGTLPRLRYNDNSWSKVSHILFVDSPVGAGFSFSREPKGYDVGDISASLQLHDFLTKWFNDHPELLANPFYIGGDSYAGMIVPFLAQIISEGIEAGKTLPNLKGYLVGNPGTGEITDFSSRVPYAHGVGIISDQLYETILSHCQGLDYINPGNVLCAQAMNTFNNLIDEVEKAHILIDKCVYASPEPNINIKTDGADSRRIIREETGTGKLNHPPAQPPFGCVTYGYYLSYFWANDRRTREALGIKKGTKDEWVRCHDKDLPYTRDLGNVIKYHRNLTSRGYRALAYSGDHDLLVPHLGTQAWVRSLNFSIVDDWRAWHLGGQSAGFTIRYSNNMTFATIKGAGHTAPEYEPERCFAMFRRWILNRPL